MKNTLMFFVLLTIATVSCERKPKEKVVPKTPVSEICQLSRISNLLYAEYNADGTVHRVTIKDSTEVENHEERYECFYAKGQLSYYNEIFDSPNDPSKRSVSITYNADGLRSEMIYHEGFGATGDPFYKTNIAYDGFKNRVLILKYREYDGAWDLEDSVVQTNNAQGRPVQIMSYGSNQKLLHGLRYVYDANSNLTKTEEIGGKITSWRKQSEFTYSPTVKQHLNLLPIIFIMGDFSSDQNMDSKDLDRNAPLTKTYYQNLDEAGNLLPQEKIDYIETYEYPSLNASGYPTKLILKDSEEEPVVQTLQYICP